MNIVEKNISELVEYENNPRDNDDAVEPVAKSIQEFGWKQPIVVDRDNVIVAGHTRCRAAKKLGLATVPVLVADDLSPDAIKAYRLVDNKTSEFAEWNLDLLKSELANIEFDLDAWQLPDLFDTAVATDIPEELNYSEKFGVVVDCTDEPMQRAVFDLVRNAGYTPRLVSI